MARVIDWDQVLKRCELDGRRLSPAERDLFRLLARTASAETDDVMTELRRHGHRRTARAVRLMLDRWISRGYLVHVPGRKRCVALSPNPPEPGAGGQLAGRPMLEAVGRIERQLAALTAWVAVLHGALKSGSIKGVSPEASADLQRTLAALPGFVLCQVPNGSLGAYALQLIPHR